MRTPPAPEAVSSYAATVDGGFHGWNTPMPYLFGGLALMLGLIAVALVVLACSFRKTSNSSTTTSAEEKPARPLDVLQPEMEPKIVVIMAGDEEPTYLAKPLSSSIHHEQI